MIRRRVGPLGEIALGVSVSAVDVQPVVVYCRTRLEPAVITTKWSWVAYRGGGSGGGVFDCV